jgi:hypothetical protein
MTIGLTGGLPLARSAAASFNPMACKEVISMVQEAHRRQRKLQRKKAKKKAERRELARRESGGLASRIARVSAAPILHCGVTDALWEEGIGEVLLSRQLHDGQVAFVVFLVDMYCLGVKDVIVAIGTRQRYDQQLYHKLASRGLNELAPQCARKLVEGAVNYALNLGLSPHPDYRIAKQIFGDISADACSEQYEYGKDGRPFFMSGPFDDRARCQQVLQALEDHCGPDGYHYVIGVEERDLLDTVVLPEDPEIEDQRWPPR